MAATEHPALMTGAMVRATLLGEKNQTRRIVRLPKGCDRLLELLDLRDGVATFSAADGNTESIQRIRCPYGKPGDRLWIREAWRSGKLTDRFPPREMLPHVVWYEADGPAPDACNGKSRRAFHMPRWACRLAPVVEHVSIERLQDLSDTDAWDEGAQVWAAEVVRNGNKFASILWAYRALWESINGAGSWDLNPWVWRVQFERQKAS